jgi:DNA repair exonuclease SbcCD ATPase subunit
VVKIRSQILKIEDRKLEICAETQKEESIKETLAKLDLIYKTVELKDFTSELVNQIDGKKSEMAILNGKRQEILQTITNANNLARNEYQSQINTINSKYQIIENELKGRISTLKSQIAQINSLLANYDNNIRSFESNYAVLSSNVLKTQKEYKEVEKEIDNIKKSVNIGLEVKRAIKSYTMGIFQDSLDSIGEQATRILNTTPNMATASIYFESAKENKDGKIKEEINGVLSVDGEESLDIKCLSGGEQTSIELAVDLAFLDMVENKVKIGCDFYFADEIFQGLDSQNSMPIIEMLKELDSSKKIAIIDHSPDVKEMIEDRLVVERIGVESNILE